MGNYALTRGRGSSCSIGTRRRQGIIAVGMHASAGEATARHTRGRMANWVVVESGRRRGSTPAEATENTSVKETLPVAAGGTVMMGARRAVAVMVAVMLRVRRPVTVAAVLGDAVRVGSRAWLNGGQIAHAIP